MVLITAIDNNDKNIINVIVTLWIIIYNINDKYSR